MADPFSEGLLIENVSGRLSPRLSFICDLHGCYPSELLFEGWDDSDKMGIMDAPGCDACMFSAPDIFPMVSDMCLAISDGSRDVSLSSRITPSGVRYLPRTVTSTVSGGVGAGKRKSVFDIESPPVKGGSEATATSDMEEAVSGVLSRLGVSCIV